MDHEWVQMRLLDLQDPELSDQERRQIHQHLETCRACREQLEHWKTIRESLSNLLESPASDVFVEQVMAKVKATPAPRPIGWRLWLDRLLSMVPGWFYPELGIAMAVLLLFMISSLRQTIVSTETLLLSRLPGKAQWMGQAKPSKETPDWDILWEEV